MRTRFAPSPTGFLHLGHAHSALTAFRLGNPMILRIEDIDPGRCRPEFITAILDDLTWLGLTWEQPVRQQSQHLADYQAALDCLRQRNLIYPCFCTRTDIARSGHAPHGPDGPVYPGTCRLLSPARRQDRQDRGDIFCLRLDMAQAITQAGPLTWIDQRTGPQQADPAPFGDVVLARKDTPTSYHLAVVVDDALQAIDLVTRGQDLFAATHVHRLLQALLDVPTPIYHHHPLILGADGVRLAKRDRAQTLRSLRQQGFTPSQIIAMAGFP